MFFIFFIESQMQFCKEKMSQITLRRILVLYSVTVINESLESYKVKKKVKLPCAQLINHYAMKAYERSISPPCLTLALDGGD
jgi:hypothetical protein